MELAIIRIEDGVVTCELDKGGIIDIARQWFDSDIKEGDIIEFNVNEHK